MNRTIFLREYPVKEEPSIFNPKSLYIASDKTNKKCLDEVFEFFHLKLGLETLRRSINGSVYIEGSFLDINKRTVRLRFFINKGIYRNVMIDDDPNVYDIRIFKKLYKESPYIKVPIDSIP